MLDKGAISRSAARRREDEPLIGISGAEMRMAKRQTKGRITQHSVEGLKALLLDKCWLPEGNPQRNGPTFLF